MSSSTAEYIANLQQLKDGDKGILRTLQHCPLDETLEGFDLFTGIWWPLRSKNPSAPKREIAWLVAKLFARYPLNQEDGQVLPALLGRICTNLREEKKQLRFIAKFDQLFSQEPGRLDFNLSWALATLKSHHINSLDWVKLTDDISIWDWESTRKAWVEKFNENYKKTNSGGKNAH